MHSSISSSETRDHAPLPGERNPKVRLAIVVVIASMVMVMLGAEMLSRYAFPRISRIEARIGRDQRQAMSIRPPAPGSPPIVLLVGNSLLLRGLDYPKIRTEMAPDAQVTRFVIENTEYLDWYYGLRHMFSSGVRPSMVFVCLNLGQTVSSRTLGDYSARHLFGVSELLPVAHDAGMSATQASALVLAHWSSFYSSRATIRNFILNKTAPSYAAALHTLADSPVSLPPDDELIRKARVRLDTLRQLCRQYGVEFVLLIPPSLGRQNTLLASAAHIEGIHYDDPLPSGTLGPEFFRADGAHLNDKGAVLFTEALAQCLRTRLGKNAITGSPASLAGAGPQSP